MFDAGFCEGGKHLANLNQFLFNLYEPITAGGDHGPESVRHDSQEILSNDLFVLFTANDRSLAKCVTSVDAIVKQTIIVKIVYLLRVSEHYLKDVVVVMQIAQGTKAAHLVDRLLGKKEVRGGDHEVPFQKSCVKVPAAIIKVTIFLVPLVPAKSGIV